MSATPNQGECPCCGVVVDRFRVWHDETCPECGASLADLLEETGEDPRAFTREGVDALGGITD